MYSVPFDVAPLDYQTALDELHASLRFGIQPMLESVEDMLSLLGKPDSFFRSLQIAGTNGKTSTSRYTQAILLSQGVRCGLYTSPELVEYTERMEIMGKAVSREAFAHGISAALEAGRRVNKERREAGLRPYDITEFDLLTVAACVVFAEAQLDAVVFECGMGGRWDATSAICSIESVAITGVGLDHTRILGDTLEKIAAEKAAIIKAGRSCVLGVGTATPARVEKVFLQRCQSEDVVPCLVRPYVLEDAAGEMHPGVPLDHVELPHTRYRITKHPHKLGFPLELSVEIDKAAVSATGAADAAPTRETYADLAALKPSYQAANIACACTLARQFLASSVEELDQEALYTAIVSCPTPGRFQLMRPNPPLLIDACHNPQSVETFLTAIRAIEQQVEDRPTLLCAVLADKDVTGIVQLLAHEFPHVVTTQTQSRRALAADELKAQFEAAGVQVLASYDSVDKALNQLKDEAVVACGSITLAGEVAALLGGSSSERPSVHRVQSPKVQL